MSERKVLSKYYPSDFDPSLVGKSRAPKQTGPKVQTVRLMAPFPMQCTSCGEYIYKGRKFNARKVTPVDEKYLNIQIYRFYIRCTRCSAEIVFRTDPRLQDYTVEKGAKRNTEPWRRGLQSEIDETDEARLDRIEREQVEAEGLEERNAMAELEAKTEDAKREMAVADALDEIRSRNARLEKAARDGVEVEVVVPEDDQRRRQDEEPMDDDEDVQDVVAGASSNAPLSTSSATASISAPPPVDTKPTAAVSTDMPPPSFKRIVKKKKDHSALLGIKKKQPLV
ncbi:hypothetical protein B0H63DRAFT_242083 [Podospora didyma]|uniref:Splicing factor YJU2 n=1 Tax=Podospora didyma TaxID=330526 RepID=A0AAE0ND38_9PEZI|nr:hypothetical protein B0H63DRAFT_242083 [Podospora didyma]